MNSHSEYITKIRQLFKTVAELKFDSHKLSNREKKIVEMLLSDSHLERVMESILSQYKTSSKLDVRRYILLKAIAILGSNLKLFKEAVEIGYYYGLKLQSDINEQ
jgi:hypothetical protein